MRISVYVTRHATTVLVYVFPEFVALAKKQGKGAEAQHLVNVLQNKMQTHFLYQAEFYGEIITRVSSDMSQGIIKRAQNDLFWARCRNKKSIPSDSLFRLTNVQIGLGIATIFLVYANPTEDLNHVIFLTLVLALCNLIFNHNSKESVVETDISTAVEAFYEQSLSSL